MAFKRYAFGNDPEAAFMPGGLLDGAQEADPDLYALPEVVAIAPPDDEEVVLYELPGGRLALVGMTVEGHPFWVQGPRAT